MTQIARVIAAARSYRGVCAVDFLGPDVIDGGTPITRLAARIQDAEDRGYAFEVIGWRNKTKVYRLLSEPDVADDPGGHPGKTPELSPPSRVVYSAEPEGLFTVPGRPHWKSDAA